MARSIRRTPQAERDLIEIWQYIADDDEQAADRTLDQFERALLTLSDHPQAGRARPELAPELRSDPVGHYVLFYRPTASNIELIRVRSGCLDIQPDDMS